MDIVVCLLLGAVVSTTDPAAVIGIFRDVGAPKRLSILAEGESLLNDAVAIAAFGLFMGILVARASTDGSGMPADPTSAIAVFCGSSWAASCSVLDGAHRHHDPAAAGRIRCGHRVRDREPLLSQLHHADKYIHVSALSPW